MNITSEQVEELLPPTVKETDLLTEDAKNTFAVLLNSLLISKGAQETGELILPTDRLKKYVGGRFERMMKAVRELEKYGLITRIPGKPRTSGEKATATRFIFNWDIIDKPIVKPTHESLFARFRNMKAPGNTSGDCNGNGNINDNFNDNINLKDNHITNSNENSNTNENSNLNDNEKDISKEEYEMEKFMLEEYIDEKAKGKSCTEINKLTIPIYDWIDRQFTNNSRRLKNFANRKLDTLKKESLRIPPTTVPVINEYEASLPF